MLVLSLLTYTAAFLATGIMGAPVALPEAQAVAVPVAQAEPFPQAVGQALADANPVAVAYALAVAVPQAEAQAAAAADALAEALPLEFDLSNADAGFTKLSTVLTTLKNLLEAGTLPQLNIGSLLTLGVGILNPVIEIIGEATEYTAVTDVLQNYTTQAAPVLGELAQTSGTDAKLDTLINMALVKYKEALIALLDTTLETLEPLQNENFIRVGLILVRGASNILSAIRDADDS